MHHIDIFLENGQFLTKNQIPLALSIKNWGIQLKKARGRSKNEKKMQKIGK